VSFGATALLVFTYAGERDLSRSRQPVMAQRSEVGEAQQS